MEFQVLWFILWGVLWAVYFMLDGFDFGAGILYPFLARDDKDKRVIINTLGPVWDGNEVWLITAGGATFAAFPTAYAVMFSYLYTLLLILLYSLIIRGVAFEFRGKNDTVSWKKTWDAAIFIGSLLPALLFGVAFGNIFKGLPMDNLGYHGSFFTLLNPYGLLTGVLFVLLFVYHGSLWLTLKTAGHLNEKSAAVSGKLWYGLLLVMAAFLVYTYIATPLFANFLKYPVWLVVPVVAVLSLIDSKLHLYKQQYFLSFIASCITVATITATGIIGLYPNLFPSNIDARYSITIFNASSGVYTLKIMTVVALVFIPVVIGYQVWAYRVFRGRVTAEGVLNDKDAY